MRRASRGASIPGTRGALASCSSPRCAARAALELTLPDPDSPAGPDLRGDGDLRELYLDLLDALFEARGGEREPQHRLLGHPDQIQDEMQTECQLVTQGLEVGTSAGWEDPRAAPLSRGAASWRLLAQLDSGFERGELMWGDAGRLYFWIHEGDLLNRRFDRTWGILQSG